METRPTVVVLSAHPLAGHYLFELLDSLPAVPYTVNEVELSELDSLGELPRPLLFVIDGIFLPMEVPQLTRILRVRYPGSKFVVVVALGTGCPEGMLRLLHAGVQGVVRLADDWPDKIPAAVDAVLGGGLWACKKSMAEFVQQTSLLLDHQARPELSLTARENQILELMMRRLSNKEIADALRVSERTVKFHISNIFAKLKIQSRRELQFKPVADIPCPLGDLPEDA